MISGMPLKTIAQFNLVRLRVGENQNAAIERKASAMVDDPLRLP